MRCHHYANAIIMNLANARVVVSTNFRKFRNIGICCSLEENNIICIIRYELLRAVVDKIKLKNLSPIENDKGRAPPIHRVGEKRWLWSSYWNWRFYRNAACYLLDNKYICSLRCLLSNLLLSMHVF